MDLKATLYINNHLRAACALKSDGSPSNRYATRTWIKNLIIEVGDIIVIVIRSGDEELSRLILHPVTKNGKTIFTKSINTKDRFVWGNIVQGFGRTAGFTSGIMFRKQAKGIDKQTEIQGKLFNDITYSRSGNAFYR